MQTILIACGSQETAERGIRVAADLSVACGARLSLAWVSQPAMMAATAGADAGQLSNVLFTAEDWRRPFRAFPQRAADRWLDSMGERVTDCWQANGVNELTAEVRARKPDLVVTCESGLARMLVAHTSAPVWRVRPREREQSWFLLRKLRCAVRGSRATAWAGTFAAGLGAEVETTRARIFGPDNADLVVIARNEPASLLAARFTPPVVVV